MNIKDRAISQIVVILMLGIITLGFADNRGSDKALRAGGYVSTSMT